MDKHDRKGPDVSCSMDASQLKELIKASKLISSALPGKKEPIREELITMNFAFSSVVSKTLIKKGSPFEIDRFEGERARIINFFRNNGVYNFQQNSIQFTAAIDSSGVDTKIPVVVDITNLQKRENDTLINVPYQIHPVSKINIYMDNPGQLGQSSSYTDSLTHNDFTIYFKGKLKYKPKALEEVIFIQKDKPYSDLERTQTYRYISNLRNFKYPSITYNPININQLDLVANIFLNPKERFSMGFDFDLSHSCLLYTSPSPRDS